MAWSNEIEVYRPFVSVFELSGTEKTWSEFVRALNAWRADADAEMVPVLGTLIVGGTKLLIRVFHDRPADEELKAEAAKTATRFASFVGDRLGWKPEVVPAFQHRGGNHVMLHGTRRKGRESEKMPLTTLLGLMADWQKKHRGAVVLDEGVAIMPAVKVMIDDSDTLEAHEMDLIASDLFGTDAGSQVQALEDLAALYAAQNGCRAAGFYLHDITNNNTQEHFALFPATS